MLCSSCGDWATVKQLIDQLVAGQVEFQQTKISLDCLQPYKLTIVLIIQIKIFAHRHAYHRMWTWRHASTSQPQCVLSPSARLPLMGIGIWFVCFPDRINYTPIPTCAAWCQSRSQHKLYKPTNEESHSHPTNSITAYWTGNIHVV